MTTIFRYPPQFAVIGDRSEPPISSALLLLTPLSPPSQGRSLLEIEMIAEFQGEFRFLSNSWPAAVQGPSDYWYASVENAYQASKTWDKTMHLRMTNMRSGESKRAGKTLVMRKDWEEVKISIMLDLVRKKFTGHGLLKLRLLQTGNEELVEGNHWGDCFWGVCKGKGENNLGKILMQVRGELSTAITN